MASANILDECPRCHRPAVPEHAKGICSMCYKREYLRDPEKRRKNNATSREWKRKHPGNWNHPPHPRIVRPATLVFCWVCGLHMLDPDATGMCGFCKKELPPWEKLMTVLLPGQDGAWIEYFRLLDNAELETLLHQAALERMRRTREHVMTRIADKMTDLYRRDGNGNLVGTPDHHRRCPTCGELAVNCKGHSDAPT